MISTNGQKCQKLGNFWVSKSTKTNSVIDIEMTCRYRPFKATVCKAFLQTVLSKPFYSPAAYWWNATFSNFTDGWMKNKEEKAPGLLSMMILKASSCSSFDLKVENATQVLNFDLGEYELFHAGNIHELLTKAFLLEVNFLVSVASWILYLAWQMAWPFSKRFISSSCDLTRNDPILPLQNFKATS